MSPGPIVVLAGPSARLAGLVVPHAPVEVVADLDRCLSRVRAEPDPQLVIIDPGWPQPLSTAVQVREANAEVGLAVAVEGPEVEAMRARLAFLPDIGHATVLDTDGDQEQLQDRIEEVIAATSRRRQLRGALDAINRDLAGPITEVTELGSSPTVSEHYLAALVRHAADAIVSLDPARRIVSINEAAQRALGLDAAAAEGLAVGELLADDDPGRFTALLDGAEQQDTMVDNDLPVRLASGQQLLMSATAARIRDDAGSLAGLVVIARDVTEERRTEERLRALQRAESMATLASGVAHDFNNLLVQILGWSDLARQAKDDRDLLDEALRNVGVATRQAADLARAMLAYGGRGEFERVELDLDLLLDDLRPLLASAVPPKIALDVQRGIDVGLCADPTQLRQVVLNLVVNAVEAIGDAEGAIIIRTDSELVEPDVASSGDELPAGTYAVVEVVDDGPGIAAPALDRLFDPFFTTKFTGRGLGLAASQGIARAHGGLISVQSRPGQGASFRVLLPANDRDAR